MAMGLVYLIARTIRLTEKIGYGPHLDLDLNTWIQTRTPKCRFCNFNIKIIVS